MTHEKIAAAVQDMEDQGFTIIREPAKLGKVLMGAKQLAGGGAVLSYGRVMEKNYRPFKIFFTETEFTVLKSLDKSDIDRYLEMYT